ncbi:MAG: penicillin-binding protein 1C [Treponema sp.]|jgi:penicillin-binding protein 1C|nr:penicillin-binding protein 1C [Treponema sp.]
MKRRLIPPEESRRAFRRRLWPAVLAGPLLWFALCLPKPLFKVSYSPVLYDREGRLLGALAAADGQWRFPPGPVNEKFAAALIEAEDRRFRRHPGVDPLALARALGQNIRAGRVVSGASTITMQCLRLMRRGRPRTVPEKALEGIMALRLEIGRSKDEILALYAANAPFGANVVGLEAAAWRWFGRGGAELSWAEAAALAVLPNSPGLIHPGRNRELLRQKRDALLGKLCRRGFFDEESLRLAQTEALPGEPLPLPRLAPHLLSRIVQEQGGAAAFNSNAGSRPGAAARGASGILFSTLDRTIQERAALILNRASERFQENGVMNGACLVLDTRTGETAAYVGNTGSAEAGDVDIVTAPRSSGSLLKPFLHAAMLDSGDLLPSALVSDIPTRVGSYSPENITRTYLGVVPAGEALARSLNVPAVRSLRRFGVDRFARLLRSLGISTLFRPGGEYGLPLILGGAEVSLWDMAGLYAGLARAALDESPGEAVFFPPRYFPAAGAAGNGGSPGVPLRGTGQPVSAGAAWLTLEALTFGVRPGDEALWQEYAGSRRIAWKTGTSFGNRDAWAVGVTADWTVAVWIGNATGEGRAELRSASTAAPVLFELFSALDNLGLSYGERKNSAWFPQPAAALKYQDVCVYSGFPPGPHCAGVKPALAPAAAPPHRPCPYCQTVTVNGAGNRVFLSEASAEPVRQESRFVLPPAEEWYYRRWNLDYRPLPAFSSDPSPAAGEAALALFNPQPGAQIYVPRELDGGEGRIVFSAAHRDSLSRIYWHLDGAYLGSTSVFHEMEARPGPGPHTLTLVDEAGNTVSRRFEALGNAEE